MALSLRRLHSRAQRQARALLGVELRYPTYRDGLRALHAAGDHLALANPAENRRGPASAMTGVK
jgi:hypothetical protein